MPSTSPVAMMMKVWRLWRATPVVVTSSVTVQKGEGLRQYERGCEVMLERPSQPQKQRETRGMRRHKAAELTMHQSEAVSDVQVLCLNTG